MSRDDGARWCCPNRDCKWSMVATIALPGEPAPRCVCGDVMQKVETIPATPTASYLEFLRGESVGQDTPGAEEE